MYDLDPVKLYALCQLSTRTRIGVHADNPRRSKKQYAHYNGFVCRNNFANSFRAMHNVTLLPAWHQAIIWNNTNLLQAGP